MTQIKCQKVLIFVEFVKEKTLVMNWRGKCSINRTMKVNFIIQNQKKREFYFNFNQYEFKWLKIISNKFMFIHFQFVLIQFIQVQFNLNEFSVFGRISFYIIMYIINKYITIPSSVTSIGFHFLFERKMFIKLNR